MVQEHIAFFSLLIYMKSKNKEKNNRRINLFVPVFLLSLLFSLSFPVVAHSHPNESRETEYAVKAGFIYNFTRFIKWPEKVFSKEPKEWIIGVLGDSPIKDSLATLASRKKGKGEKIIIKGFSSLEEINKCHILFISHGEKRRIESIVAKVKNSPVLLIGDSPGFEKKGIGINLVIRENKVRFQINKDALERAGLRASSSLLNLGSAIHKKFKFAHGR